MQSKHSQLASPPLSAPPPPPPASHAVDPRFHHVVNPRFSKHRAHPTLVFSLSRCPPSHRPHSTALPPNPPRTDALRVPTHLPHSYIPQRPVPDCATDGAFAPTPCRAPAISASRHLNFTLHVTGTPGRLLMSPVIFVPTFLRFDACRAARLAKQKCNFLPTEVGPDG